MNKVLNSNNVGITFFCGHVCYYVITYEMPYFHGLLKKEYIVKCIIIVTNKLYQNRSHYRDRRTAPHCTNLKYLLLIATNALISLFFAPNWRFQFLITTPKLIFKRRYIIKSRIILLASKDFVLNKIVKFNIIKQAP